jgi:hypothetical protein
MKTVLRFVVLAVATALMILVAPVSAIAQKASPQMPDAPRYDLRQEITIKGTVLDVKDYSCPISGGVGTHVTLKTAEGDVVVHLALANFAREYGIQITAGQHIEMIGVRMTFRDQPAFMPRILKINNDTYFLRDKNGTPLWSGL